ncbi:MaoC/PaaZ C-terminal domain-containing protein [Flavobacterium terrisoli]|uniref:MaoC/PaaZ C-terminal domain-containing protein n=1 Tax=Flavobacterium terrisoli TaxID=3242195 RepID=UPI0025433C14|nr:MaoC/PaaZ C-terminal domain-containing protein [Flavobacterium buctense]
MFKVDDTFTEKFTVSNEIYHGFITLFKDQNPLHTDALFATEKGFKAEVMHGNILNGFLSYFIGEGLPTKNVIIHSQEIQYKNPVYLNETLDFKATVIGFYESVNAVEFKFDFKNPETKVVAKGKIQIGLL